MENVFKNTLLIYGNIDKNKGCKKLRVRLKNHRFPLFRLALNAKLKPFFR